MDWEFYQRGEAGDANAAPQSRIIIEGDHTISRFEIFVREVLQNSLDAVIQGKKAKVHFRLRNISAPGAKQAFLDAMGWPALKERVSAANRIRERRDEPAEFGDPNTIEKLSLRIVEIVESGTIGLVGREAVRDESEEKRWPGEPPKAYIALTRDDARREKQGLGSGGTYGLGKAVLWATSDIQTVLFFSRLSQPWEDTVHRAAAQSRLGPHFLNKQAFRGLGYGGDRKEDWCRPIRNEKARSLATKLGINRREGAEDSGTTILIPFWRPPDCADGDEDVQTHALISRYAARYFWPAIVDERLEVSSESEDGDMDNASNHMSHHQPFIDLYKRVRGGVSGDSDAKPENISVTVPKGPPPRKDSEAKTFVIAAMHNVLNSEELREDFRCKVACIRGQGMVVGYAKMTGNTLVRPFVGIALGGRASDTKNGERGDVLLGFSEYVTHTKWDARSANFRYWPEARSVVAELLKQLRDYYEKNSRIQQPETSDDLSPLEEGLRFPGIGAGGPPPPPPQGRPTLRLQSFRREDENYAFEIRARAGPEIKPFCVDVSVEPAMETGSASKSDRFLLDNVQTVPADLKKEKLDNKKVRVLIPTFNSETQIKITGLTAKIPAEVFAVSEGLLKASVVKPAASQDTAAEIPGEDSYD
jgi:RNA polymerase primary sigma factor